MLLNHLKQKTNLFFTQYVIKPSKTKDRFIFLGSNNGVSNHLCVIRKSIYFLGLLFVRGVLMVFNHLCVGVGPSLSLMCKRGVGSISLDLSLLSLLLNLQGCISRKH